MILTKEIIKQGASVNGGYSKRQLKLLGISWPPIRGWVQEIIGVDIAQNNVAKFLSLTNKHLKTRKRAKIQNLARDRK